MIYWKTVQGMRLIAGLFYRLSKKNRVQERTGG